MKQIQKVFSFSNVIAVLALFVALGGSVYAASSKTNGNKINGSKIKPKSIPGNRIKARSLTGAQVKARTLTGAKIKPGSLTGKQVVGRSLSGVSASSLASVLYAVTTIPLDPGAPAGTSTAAGCGPGQKVIGGGAVISNDLFGSVSESGPQVSRTGWEATAHAWTNGATMTVTAICTAVVSISGSERTEPRPGVRYQVP
ncbi:MAG TPA: hypothetical protein VEW07_06850 [Solirubrobacterales bacterium]|nr:hypothetical protein [Solirubrobacterales bacterium]